MAFSATIVADVKRFSYQINTDEVFDTHRPRLGFAGHLVGALLETPRHVEVKRLFLEIDHLSLPKIISGRNDGATRVAAT